MRKLAIFFYRIFVKNKLIRWILLLGLATWLLKIGTEKWLGTGSTPPQKVIFEADTARITTIEWRDATGETTFARGDSTWFVVKDNITVKLSDSNIKAFLGYLSRITAHKLQKIDDLTPFKAQSNSLNILYTDGSRDSFFLYEKNIFFNNTALVLPKKMVAFGISDTLWQFLRADYFGKNDKSLFSFTDSMVYKIKIQDTLSVFSVEKKGKNWVKTPSNTPFASEKVENYLKNLKILRGGDIYAGSQDFMQNIPISHRICLYFDNDSAYLYSYQLAPDMWVLSASRNKRQCFIKRDSVSDIFNVIK